MIVDKISSKNLGLQQNIDFRILREDLFPNFGGGNKARKLKNILYEIQSNNFNAVVTTGSIYSNHCRAAALMCSNNGLALTLVLHGDKNRFEQLNGNAGIVRATKHKLIFCEPDLISETMNNEINHYEIIGMKPYYLYGGGHNIKGVEAYIELVPEIQEYCKDIGWNPDFIFLPTGTGSTQAGLIIGSIQCKKDWKIIGISIARNRTNGINAIIDSLNWFNIDIDKYRHKIFFDDRYLAGGYAKYNTKILELSSSILRTDSLFLDPIYTAKALWGTIDYIKINRITGNVLFINTGGLFNFFK